MANRNSDYKYILGMQCFANADSGACIIRTKYDSKEYDYVVINVPLLNKKLITLCTESYQSVIWHCLVSHPLLQINKMKW